ncbi:hypothetical protein [Ancylobacter sp.]|uniref:hypothetical protein n=1 Tax=Ancylobacter sp. TaxID=1872567 RepID=UPI003BAB396D
MTDIIPLRQPDPTATPIGVDMETGNVLFEDGVYVKPLCLFDKYGDVIFDMDGAAVVVCETTSRRWIIDLEAFEGRALQ